MIDIRSDTVTLPTKAMRKAMHDAEVGDDVYKDDPTVVRLQDQCAELLGHEAALFMPSGTQSNLVALLTHCQRGDEYIVGADAHIYKYEGGGAAAFGGIQPQPIPFAVNGELPLDKVESVIKSKDIHYANSKLICIENTQAGRVLGLDYMQRARKLADAQQLQLHLDGARMANAAVVLNTSLESIGKTFHSVSLCLSKGLGAPVGSVLLGDKAFIEQALRWRKMTGGGMRQAGILAAAGILAITDGFARMHEDHEHAQLLADKVSNVPGVTVRPGWTQSNMVWLDYDGDHGTSLPAFAKQHGIKMSSGRNAGRLVMHRDISTENVHAIANMISAYFEQNVAAIANG